MYNCISPVSGLVTLLLKASTRSLIGGLALLTLISKSNPAFNRALLIVA
jgi:hypothetical protein